MLLDLIEQHTGQGALGPKAQARLTEIAGLLPPLAGGEGCDLFRALTVSKHEYLQLMYEGRLSLEPRDFECWSKSHTAVRQLARLRAQQRCAADAHDDTLLILKRTFTREDVFLDLEEFYRAGGPSLLERRSWHNYVSKEAEVIVRTGGAVQILVGDIFETSPVYSAQTFSLWPGETFEVDGEDRVIEEYIGPDDCGNALVRSGGLVYEVAPIWEFPLSGIERPTHEPDLDMEP